MRAALYARVSTHDQQTLAMQRDALHEFATRRGWTVIDTVEEIASGAKDRRPKRQALLMAAKQRKLVSFSEVAFINYVGFPPCCSRLLIRLFTATPLQCVSFLPEEAFTDRHSQVLSGERDPRLQAVTTRETADEGSLGTRLLHATAEDIEAYCCQ